MSPNDPARRLWRTGLALASAVLVLGCHGREERRPAAPAPSAAGPASVEVLTQEAARLVGQNRLRQARAYALKADAILQGSDTLSQPAPEQDAETLRRLTAVLADVGEYETAMSLVGLEPPSRQQEGFRFLILHIINARDRRGVSQVLPTVTRMFATAPSSALDGATDLAEVVRRLALSGFRPEALAADRALDPRRALLPPSVRLRLQADLGDVQGAVAAANALGPLTQPASPMVETLTSAPRADALAAIAVDLAEAGRIDRATAVAGQLDAAPPQAVASSRDYALAAIADAQAKQGDIRAAERTIRRIYQPAIRNLASRKLANAA